MDAIFDFLAPIGLNETNFQFMLVAAILGCSIYVTLYGGMFSLANAGFMAIGAYVSVVLTQRYEWAFLPAIVAGMAAAGLIAIPVGLPVLRLSDIYLAIATIGFGEVVIVLIRNFDRIYQVIFDERIEITGGGKGIKNIPVMTETPHLIIFLVIVVYFLYRMQNSRFGRALAAIRQDETVAANLGINVVYYKNMAFIIGAMLAAGAGGLSGHLNRIIETDDYGFERAVTILTYAVLGGTTSFLGPVIGGMSLRYLPELLRRLKVLNFVGNIVGRDLTNEQAAVDGVINGIVLILFIVYLPGGIANPQLWRGLYQRFRRKKSPDMAEQNTHA